MLNALQPDEFADRLKGIFEYSPWIAEIAAADRPFSSVGALHVRMVEIVDAAATDRKRALLTAHPELGAKGPLTTESASEQGLIGLDRLADDAAAHMAELNAAYRKRFGYPFIVAVRGQRDPAAIRQVVERRLVNSPEHELPVALAEVAKIAGFRLRDLVSDGP